MEARLAALEEQLGNTEAAKLRTRLAELGEERAALVAERGPLVEEVRAMREAVEKSRVALLEAEAAHRRLQGEGGKAANRLALVNDQTRELDREAEQVKARLAELARLEDAPLVRNLSVRRT